MDWNWLIWVIVGYLCGSVPFGLLIGLSQGVDIRKAGSGNVGATNTGRVLGRKWGVLCLALDAAKGALPVALAGAWMGVLGQGPEAIVPAQAWSWLAVATAAVLGHMFPVWLRFRGGKGVATGLGVLLGMYPVLTWPAVIATACWIAVVLLTRYVSLASLIAAAAMPVYLLALGAATETGWAALTPFLTVTLLLAGLVFLRHRANIVRLAQGQEPRVKLGGGRRGGQGDKVTR